MRTSKYTKPKWAPFKQEPVPKKTMAQHAQHAASLGIPLDDYLSKLSEPDEFWVNNFYQVLVRNVKNNTGNMPDVKHLSIRRRDNEPVHDWRDLQRIKNELVGAECEGVEIYPAESRLVDTANQYHLWVFVDPTFRFPLGYQDRLVVNKSSPATKQRPIR